MTMSLYFIFQRRDTRDASVGANLEDGDGAAGASTSSVSGRSLNA